MSWTRLSNALVWIFSLSLLFLRHFPSVDFNLFFLGRTSDRQDLGALVSTGILGLMQSHPTVAVWSLHLSHLSKSCGDPRTTQYTSVLRPQWLSHFNLCLSWINAKSMKKTQLHKSLLVRKSYFQKPKRDAWKCIMAPAKAGTRVCTVDLSYFLPHHQRPWACLQISLQMWKLSV